MYWKTETLKIFHDNVLAIDEITEGSIDLIVTSPPYNVDIAYGSYEDDAPYSRYMEFNHKWLSRCYKWLKDDGRICLNVPLDTNKGGLQSVGADFTTVAKNAGLTYQSTIIWNEGNISRRTAWGSWMRASAPYVIAPVELIIVMYKHSWKKRSGSQESDITRDEFLEWTNGLWNFSGESKKRVGHPAPFPVELPYRCIKMFSFVGDTVLDPFLGSGTTLIAAGNTGRKGLGIEVDEEYCKLAQERIIKEGSPSFLRELESQKALPLKTA